ncbi:protoporphyrinogen/coproporphyrinogen oxidase, partial [Brachybacterium epidermidis]|uniref:protoporphyrinogen/coproporphyrinogen oxidase n=1 Tax=Brachybacterium epidermidis TaxID=2781983 RepID=UPI00398E7703
RSLRPETSRSSRRGAGTAVRALTPTMAELPRALETQLRSHGGEVLTGTRALAVARKGDGTWQVTAFGTDQGASTSGAATGGAATSGADGTEVPLEAEHLVLACPPDVAATLLEQALPTLARAIPSAPAVPVRLVALVLEAPALDSSPSGTGALVAAGTPEVRAKALTHATAKWEHVRRAAGGLHVVRLSYGRPGEGLPEDDSHGPDGTEGTIIDLALADASTILRTPLGRSQLRAARVITWQRAMRRPGPGHREALEAITELLAQEPSLELVGAWRAGTGIEAIVRADARAMTTPDPSTHRVQEDRP